MAFEWLDHTLAVVDFDFVVVAVVVVVVVLEEMAHQFTSVHSCGQRRSFPHGTLGWRAVAFTNGPAGWNLCRDDSMVPLLGPCAGKCCGACCGACCTWRCTGVV